jgi:sodium/potassium-transporting ATPase subunit alpha
LIGVAFMNALIEFVQLQRSEAILASFLAMIPPSCRVIRDSIITTVPAADLVKGDVVLLVRLLSKSKCLVSLTTRTQRGGDKAPADLVLFNGADLKVDNSSLTGESEPQERGPLPDGSKSRPVEAQNLVSYPATHMFQRHSVEA